MSEDALAKRWQLLRPLLNEQQRRRWAAIEADALGDRGIQIVARATGMARQTVRRGLDELAWHRDEGTLGTWFLDPALAQREEGGGRKADADNLMSALSAKMKQQAPGSRWRSVVFRWTCDSLRKLGSGEQDGAALASHTKIAAVLDRHGYDLISEPWATQRHSADERAKQYSAVASAVTAALDAPQPVIVLNLSKACRADDWHGRDEDDEVVRVARVNRALAATLWGRDNWDEQVKGETLARQGWSVSAPDEHTVGLAAQTVRRWWDADGLRSHEKCGEVLIVTNALGLDGALEERWKLELSRFAVEAGVGVRCCYLPPGICQWTHCASRFGALLAMREQWSNVARHKVICRVIDWTALPESESFKAAERLREGRRSQAAHRPSKPQVGIRFQVPDADVPRKNWDYSITIG